MAGASVPLLTSNLPFTTDDRNAIDLSLLCGTARKHASEPKRMLESCTLCITLRRYALQPLHNTDLTASSLRKIFDDEAEVACTRRP